MLFDARAAAYILYDKSKFVKIHDKFKPESHFIELADCSRAKIAKGRAKAILHDVEDNVRKVFLEDNLYVPSYK